MSRTPDALLAGITVLLVDDDARNTFALSSYLDMIGMQIHTAENGFQALDFLSRHPHTHLVLMDMMMPELDGYEAIQHIRANPLTRQIPVIAVTAKAMKGDREKCLQAGASDYVSKPINMPELLEKMARLL